jgi:hypothetical protein
VVTTRSGEEDDFVDLFVKYWGDDSDIREMSWKRLDLKKDTAISGTDDPPA